MEYPIIESEALKFPISSGMVVSGPSGSGKTEWVLQLLENSGQMFDPIPNSPLIPQQERRGVAVHAGAPSDDYLKNLPTPFVIVYDILMGDIDAKRLADLFTKKAHHNNFCVIFLAQNLFDKAMRVPRSNAQYLVLMRAPNDMLSIRNLAAQIFPREGAYFLGAYKQACAQPY